jgi:hypothetical protein
MDWLTIHKIKFLMVELYIYIELLSFFSVTSWMLIIILKSSFFIIYGAVAHLARALHLHCRGKEFDSPRLHHLGRVAQLVRALH